MPDTSITGIVLLFRKVTVMSFRALLRKKNSFFQNNLIVVSNAQNKGGGGLLAVGYRNHL